MSENQDLILNKLNEIHSWEVATCRAITDLLILERYNHIKKTEETQGGGIYRYFLP